jgi:hypothetical protein
MWIAFPAAQLYSGHASGGGKCMLRNAELKKLGVSGSKQTKL